MKRLKKIIIVLFIVFIILNIATQVFLTSKNYGITIIDLYQQQIPKKDNTKASFPKQYINKSNNYFEQQGLNECAGYASAYFLRNYNHNIDGSTIYQKLNPKFSNGYIMPQAIINHVKNYNITLKLYSGSLEQLKTHLINQKSIIVLINDPTIGLHYVNVVGYTKNKILLADSLKNNSNKRFNNYYSNEDFLKAWQTNIPFFNNSYYLIEK